MRILLKVCFFLLTYSNVSSQCTFPSDPADFLVCEQARFICGNELDGYTDRQPLENNFPGQPQPGCPDQGSAENIIWFSFILDDPDFRIEIEYSNCTDFDTGMGSPGLGLQAGMYADCDTANYNKVACRTNFGYATLVLEPYQSAIDDGEIQAGQLVYMFIDGLSGSVCDFEINVINGICTDNLPPAEECPQDCSVFSVDDHACTDLFTYEYSVRPEALLSIGNSCFQDINLLSRPNLFCLEWEIMPDVGYTIVDEASGLIDRVDTIADLTLRWTEPGTYTIKPIITLNPDFDECIQVCDCTSDVVFTVEVEETTLNLLGQIELCPGEEYEFCGELYSSSQNAECRDRENCIVERISFVDRPMQFIDLGTQFICDSECFQLQNVDYCVTDNYSVLHESACDTTYEFEVVDVTIAPSLLSAESIIDCNNISAEAEGTFTTNYQGSITTYWLNESNDIVSNDENLSVQQEGIYTFVVEPDGIPSCRVSITHTVTTDETSPNYQINVIPTVDCNTISENISIMAVSNVSNVNWEGPNFLGSGLNVDIIEGGEYYIEVIGDNGCLSFDTIQVPWDTISPTADVLVEPIICSEESPAIGYTSSDNIQSNIWYDSDNTQLSLDALLSVTAAGDYFLEIESDNGCVSRVPFMVEDLRYNPRLGNRLDTFWRCDTDEITFDWNRNLNDDLIFNWESVDGEFRFDDDAVYISSTGQFILELQDTLLGCVGYDTINVLEFPDPFVSIDAQGVTPPCTDSLFGGVELSAIVGGKTPLSYQVNSVEYADPSLIELPVGEYELIVFDDFGCTVSDSFAVNEAPEFRLGVLENMTIGFLQDSLLTVYFEEGEILSDRIEWFDEMGNLLNQGTELLYTASVPQMISVVATSMDGCVSEISFFIDISYEVEIFRPNVFSPNGDNQNDRFVLYNKGIPFTMDRLQIFDRSGSLVYDVRDQPFNEDVNGWDGTYNGQFVEQGVYVFILEYTRGDNLKVQETGTITVLR